MRAFMVGGLLVGLLAWAGIGRAGEPQPLAERVADLERRVAVLEAGKPASGPASQLSDAERAALISLGKAFRMIVTLEQKDSTVTRFMPPERMVQLQEIDAKAAQGIYAPAWPAGVGVRSAVQDLALLVQIAHLRGWTRQRAFQDRLFPWTAQLSGALERGDLAAAWQAKQQIEAVVPRSR